MEKIYYIKSGEWEAQVCPALGGNLISLSYAGKNILRPLTDETQIEINPYLQGAPILLPANRTYKGKFTFEGVEYTLPITEMRTDSNLHGIVHRQSFSIVNSDEKSITLSYVNKGQAYPFDFEMTVTYSICKSGAMQEYKIKNIGNKNMPYTFCLHTTFMIPENFTLPIKSRQEHNEIDIPTGKYVELTPQEKTYLTGSKAKNIAICGYYEGCGHTATIDDIVYTVSDNFDHWIMYNAQGEKDFLCLEPQAGKVNGLNISDGHKVLKPNEEVLYKTSFTHK